MRLGIFGGSFDPVHNGHLALARACQRQAVLDEVWFVPTAVQPLKQDGPHASAVQRVEMLRLAIDSEVAQIGVENNHARSTREPGRPRPRSTWRVCTLEVDRGGRSYSVETVRQIHEELPDAELFFLIGSDALREVARWREPREIFGLATPLVVHRAGAPKPDLATLAPLCSDETQPQLIEMPSTDVSSSQIRNRLAAGDSIDGLAPPTVASYIAANHLYC